MREGEPRRVQRLAPKFSSAWISAGVAPGGSRRRPPYTGSPTMRITDVREMHADLVRAPGLEPHAQ